MDNVKRYIPKIKICGLKSISEIKMINTLPIDYVGYVFAESKRKVSIQQVRKMNRFLRHDIKSVGVFVNENVDKVNKIAKECGLNTVQLHGDEKPTYCININVQVWKSFSVKNECSIKEIEVYKHTEGILLDSYSINTRGGTGKTFDWNWSKNLSKRYFTILAGGLNADNVLEAIDIVRPDVIDVSSGVETDNKKDFFKIKDLIRKVKKYEYK